MRVPTLATRLLPLNPSTVALLAWTGIILAAGLLPLDNFSGHPHWRSIRWAVRPEDWGSGRFYFDVVANIGLFYPLGLLLARHVHVTRWQHVGSLGSIGLTLSAGIELFQVYCHNRRPSVIDLTSNTTGTILGLLTAARVYSSHHMNRWLPARYSHPTGS